MEIEQVKKNLNKMVVYKGVKDAYKMTACILRKSKNKFFYQVEMQDIKCNNSIVYGRLNDVCEVEQ